MSRAQRLNQTLRVSVRLIIASACIAAISLLIQKAVTQLSAELEHQTALVQSGIPQIQSAFAAAQLQPDNYDYRRLLAKSYARQGYQRQAQDNHIDKLQLRPSWPFAWFDFARWYADNNKLETDQFNVALAHSEKLGCNEISLRKARARLALDVLDRDLSRQVNTQLREALIREFDARPHYVYAHAALKGNEGVVCRNLEDVQAVVQWCGQMEYFRQVCASEVVKMKKHRDWCNGKRLMWESWI